MTLLQCVVKDSNAIRSRATTSNRTMAKGKPRDDGDGTSRYCAPTGRNTKERSGSAKIFLREAILAPNLFHSRSRRVMSWRICVLVQGKRQASSFDAVYLPVASTSTASVLWRDFTWIIKRKNIDYSLSQELLSSGSTLRYSKTRFFRWLSPYFCSFAI